MKRYLPFAIIAAVALITVGAGAAIYRAKLQRIAAAAVQNIPDPSGAKPGAKPAHLYGPAKAPVTIEEFADFQCPPCASLSLVVKELARVNPERVRVVFRHYPLNSHKNAMPAAVAAEAAGAQGRFWEMHDLLFKNQAAWSKDEDPRALFQGYATTLGLDAARFATDTADEKLKARVTADQERATSMGVSRTPSLFINAREIPSTSFNMAALQAAIQAAAEPRKPEEG